MKTCPLCGLDLEESYLYCPEDGSTLTHPETTALADAPAPSADEAGESPARPVILYCPACAAEYPLTFSECPVHGVPLTQHRLPTFVEPPTQAIEERPERPVLETGAQSHQEARSTASHGPVAAIPVSLSRFDEQVLHAPDAEIENHTARFDSSLAADEQADRKSFRVAAIMLVVALAALSLGGLYTFYVNATRKPASPATKLAERSLVATQESAFIPTPEAARDYKEEPAAPPDTVARAVSGETDKDKASGDVVASLPSRQAAQKVEEKSPPAVAKQRAEIAAPPPAAVTRPTGATDLVLPRGTYGLVGARLIRMRARQTPSGVRYDLTFNLEEQAGRTTQYERLAVITRSASGINHSEAMPFYHRLGAAGTLTFTISVEMKGRAQSDWQGRIICTSFGTDNQGRPLRTSFGANVSP
jgi:cytoskeletal protein RodZ